MFEYPKIETLYDRGPDFKVVPVRFRWPEFGAIKLWSITEKIDGMNVRVKLTTDRVWYGGRTDAAQLPTGLVDWLRRNMDHDRVAAAFEPVSNHLIGETIAYLFLEAYGPKIQAGHKYRDSIACRLFDVCVFNPTDTEERHPLWLTDATMRDIAAKIGIAPVPCLNAFATIDEAIAYVRQSSTVAHIEKNDDSLIHEGIVAKSNPLLLNRRAERIMWKLKVKDLGSSF